MEMTLGLILWKVDASVSIYTVGIDYEKTKEKRTTDGRLGSTIVGNNKALCIKRMKDS